MKLYFFQGSCALAPHITLEWVGADYETEEIKRSDTRTPEYLERVSPHGKVPVLELDDGRKLTQVPAIQTWLANTYPDANLGAGEGPDGAYEMLSLMARFNGDVHPAFTPYFMTFKFTTDDAAKDSVKGAAVNEIGFQMAALNAHMEGRDWVLGDRRSILDPYLFVFCSWGRFVPGIMDDRPNLKAFAKRMMGDEGVQSALKQQGLA